MNKKNDWREEIKNYIDKNIEILGDIVTYYPNPEEQQTSEGNIIKIINIKYLKIIE